jgi:3-deoxy-D-manno-octulosonic-acid transferase
VRAYLRALQPKMLVLMESELWPRMLAECGRAGVPVAVVNARVSDKSFARGLRAKAVWGNVLRRVDLFLAQSEEDARRLVTMGARAEGVRAIGNLKYDVRAAKVSRMAGLIREAAAGRPVLVAGSTLEREEQMVIDAWDGRARSEYKMLLVLAPRHPDRFEKVYSLASRYHRAVRATDLLALADAGTQGGDLDIVLLNTVGDLAAVYGVATIAFVGGSMVPKGGHNPLEPAQFGVPIIMGTSWENFKDIVYQLSVAGGMCYLSQDDAGHLQGELHAMLLQPDYIRRMGEQAKLVFEKQSGATGRAVEALVGLVKK